MTFYLSTDVRLKYFELWRCRSFSASAIRSNFMMSRGPCCWSYTSRTWVRTLPSSDVDLFSCGYLSCPYHRAAGRHCCSVRAKCCYLWYLFGSSRLFWLCPYPNFGSTGCCACSQDYSVSEVPIFANHYDLSLKTWQVVVAPDSVSSKFGPYLWRVSQQIARKLISAFSVVVHFTFQIARWSVTDDFW